MEGFQDGIPFQVAVRWLPVVAATGLPQEFTLIDWRPSTSGGGVIATIANGQGGQDRYFLPWESIWYLRQSIPSAPAPVAPTNVLGK